LDNIKKGIEIPESYESTSVGFQWSIESIRAIT
jgi:hypothetical protein